MSTTERAREQVSEDGRPLRADAVQNRNRILAAARDVFVEHGPSAPLEEVSRRAGCGIATLYRRFPDRAALIRAVVLDALHRTAEAARRAVKEEGDPFDALVRYMHDALDIRTGAVIPALLEEIPFQDAEIDQVRAEGAQVMENLLDKVKQAGAIRPEVTFADIGLLIVRFSRPLPGPFPPAINHGLGHRHLDLTISGLRPGQDSAERVTGPALGYDDLRGMFPEET
jgi:AcrR family transcriptional regulator